MADDWMNTLRKACESTSQREVADRLGVSPSALSGVLKGKYAASTSNFEKRVRGVLMNEKVRCPVGGVISKKLCQDQQGRPFIGTSPLRVMLSKTCPKCPNARKAAPS